MGVCVWGTTRCVVIFSSVKCVFIFLSEPLPLLSPKFTYFLIVSMNSIHLSIARVSVSIILLCFSTFYYSLLISFLVTASLFSLTSPFCLYTSLFYHLGTRLPSIYSYPRDHLHLFMPLLLLTLSLSSQFTLPAQTLNTTTLLTVRCTTFQSTKRRTSNVAVVSSRCDPGFTSTILVCLESSCPLQL